MSVVPRTSVFPRFVASTTVGAMGDSRSALRYVICFFCDNTGAQIKVLGVTLGK